MDGWEFLNFHIFFIVFMCMGMLSACIMYNICAVPDKARRGRQIPGTSVTYSCELPCGFWDSNLSPLEEQFVLLTTKPPLQSHEWEII